MDVTVEINRHEQCNYLDPASIPKAGCTLEDFKPDFKADLHPLNDRDVARFAACHKRFFGPKILYCVVSI